MTHHLLIAFKSKRKLFFIVSCLFFLCTAIEAQTPQGVPRPHENEPFIIDDLPTFIIYIAVPVAAALLYFILKRRRNLENKKKSRKEDKL